MTCTTCDSCQDLDTSKDLEPQFNSQAGETRRLINFLKATCSDPILYKLLYQFACSNAQFATAILDISKKNVGATQADLDALRLAIQTQLDNLGTASTRDVGTAVGNVVEVGTNGKLDPTLIPTSTSTEPADYDTVKRRLADVETKTTSLTTDKADKTYVDTTFVKNTEYSGDVWEQPIPVDSDWNVDACTYSIHGRFLVISVRNAHPKQNIPASAGVTQTLATLPANIASLLKYQIDIVWSNMNGGAERYGGYIKDNGEIGFYLVPSTATLNTNHRFSFYQPILLEP